MRGHAKGDRSVRVAEVPRKRFASREDEGQRAGPKRFHEGSRGIRNLFSERVESWNSRHEHGGRSRTATALRGEQSRDSGRAEGITRDAVDGVGGDDDELPAPKSTATEPQALEKLRLDGAVVDGRHVAHHPTEPILSSERR